MISQDSDRGADPLERARRVKREIEAAWLELPGVVAVGVGQGADGGPAIVVSVEADSPRIRASIPTDVRGVPVEVRVTGPIRPM